VSQSFSELPKQRIGSLSSLLDVVVMTTVALETSLFGGVAPLQDGYRLFCRVIDAFLPLAIPLMTSQHFLSR
jgi:hypothetical protein